jgi:hypothetical protein
MSSLASTASAQSSTAPQSSTLATISPSLSPDRLGAEGALQLNIHFAASSESGVPSPVRRSVLRFPAGLGVEIPHLRSCSLQRLRILGPSACPKQSLLGHGHAIAEAQAGSQVVSEGIDLTLFVGPFHNLQPTFEILGQGYTPFDERVVLTGTVLPDNPPYGEDLVLSIPPIPTLPLEPAASIVSMSLTVGASKPHHPITVNTVVVPPSCPKGGFPFAAEFTYADGSSGSALAGAPCPSAARPAALAARALSLKESGNLHLTSKQGFTLNEQGPASGTVGGTIYVHLKILSSTRVSAEINMYPPGGSITCVGSASYKRQGSSANFSGSLSIERGTGSYAHAHGSGLSFNGTIQRSNDAVTVHVGGTASD